MKTAAVFLSESARVAWYVFLWLALSAFLVDYLGAVTVTVPFSSSWTNLQDGGTSNRSINGTFVIDVGSGHVTCSGTSSADHTGGNNAVRYGASTSSYTNVVVTSGVVTNQPFSVSFDLVAGDNIYIFSGNSGPNTPNMSSVFHWDGSSSDASVQKKKTKLIPFKNDTGFKIRYDVKNAAGGIVESFTVNPGESYYRQFQRDSTDTGQWTVEATVLGAQATEAGVLMYTGSSSDTVSMGSQNFLNTGSDWGTAGASNPGISSTGVSPPSASVSDDAKPPPVVAPKGPKNNEQYRGNVLWSGDSGAAATDALKTGDFKEGIEQLVGELKKANDYSDAEEKRIDEAKADAQKAVDDGPAKMEAKQSEAEAEASSAIPSASSFSGTASKSNSIFSITLPGSDLISPKTVNVDPSGNTKWNTVVAWLRGVLAVLVSGYLTWWLYQELGQYLFFSSLLAPARGNPIAQGAGGQLTSGLVAAWMTLTLLAMPTALMALVDSADLLVTTGTAVVNIYDNAPSGIGQGAVYLVYLILPVPVIATALTTMFVAKKGGMVIYFGVAAAIRWAIAVVAFGAIVAASTSDVQAAVTVANYDSSPVNVAYGVQSATVAAGSTVDLMYSAGDLVVVGGRARTVVDNVIVAYSASEVTVHCTLVLFLEWFMFGFVAQGLLELKGLALRVLGRVASNNAETL